MTPPVLGNIRALRRLLRDCQARVKELESGSLGSRKCVSFKAEPDNLENGDGNEPQDSDEDNNESNVTPGLEDLHPSLKAQLKISQGTASPAGSRSRGDSTTSSRPSLLRSDEDNESNYVGSYGKLVSFLRASRTDGAITESEAAELLAAVEDISRLGIGQQVRKSQPLFRGTSKQDFATLLPSMGIEVPITKDDSHSGERKSITMSASVKVGASSEASEGCAQVLADYGFNCRTRGDILVDAEVVVRGFSTPFDLLERYSIDSNILRNWVVEIAKQYRPNSYHNWMHALDVFQFCYLALANGEAGEYFEDEDVMALLTATVAHDTNHPGYNNAFIINTSHDVAITYNDKSPLESMHASLCFQTLRREGLNFLSGMPDADYKTFRSKVIDAILATDMSHHFELVDRFSARVSARDINPFFKGPIHDAEKQNAGKEDRRMLLQAFTHMADLGHCCRPWHVHRHMVVALENEFFLQGDKERELGIPVMPLMDRKKDSAAASQGFFLSKMVTPLLEAFCVVLKDDLGHNLQTNTTVNGHRWSALINLHGKLTAAQLVDKELAEENDKPQQDGVRVEDCVPIEGGKHASEANCLSEHHVPSFQRTPDVMISAVSMESELVTNSACNNEQEEELTSTPEKPRVPLADSFPTAEAEQKKNDGTASPRPRRPVARLAASPPDRKVDQKDVSQAGPLGRLRRAGLG